MNSIEKIKSRPDVFWLICVILVLLSITVVDALIDVNLAQSPVLLALELFISAISLAGICWLVVRIRRNNQYTQQLQLNLRQSQQLAQQLTHIQQSRRKALSALVLEQFDEWQLTASEREVALLLLKGFSTKEIALLRQTSDSTVRQQASALYKKAGVAGRHVFSAWFFEDLG